VAEIIIYLNIAHFFNAYLTSLGHLGQRDTERIISILCRAAQGGQGKNNGAVADGFANELHQCK